jgi:hypothetical protein
MFCIIQSISFSSDLYVNCCDVPYVYPWTSCFIQYVSVTCNARMCTSILTSIVRNSLDIKTSVYVLGIIYFIAHDHVVYYL